MAEPEVDIGEVAVVLTVSLTAAVVLTVSLSANVWK